MPYFKESTASPTGIRPWNFAMQGSGSGSNGLGRLGRGRLGRLGRGRLGFYANSNYPLPQASNGPLMLTAGVPGGQQLSRTLGDFLPRIPLLATSPYSGKADYGDPPPAYGPLNPAFFKMGLGFAVIDGAVGGGGLIPPIKSCPAWGCNGPMPVVVSGAGTPVVTSPVSTVVPAQSPSSWLQQWQAQQAANQAAQQTASSSSAAPSSQSAAVAAPAAMFTTDSAGDIIYATGGSIFLTAAQASAIGVTAASLNAGGAAAVAAAATAAANVSASTAAATTAPSWFTDPNQALITGLPNWGLLAIAGGALYLFKKK